MLVNNKTDDRSLYTDDLVTAGQFSLCDVNEPQNTRLWWQ